jgi:uncharacterized membrane protein HdeD (DUF308 family)
MPPLEEDQMTTYDARSGPAGLSVPPTWLRVLLGIVLILAGLFVLGDVVVATIISTIFIGAFVMAAGIWEIIHAFWTKGWGGFAWQIILGVLYVAAGLVLVTQPVSGALMLTYFLGLLLLFSGVVRIFIGFTHWRDVGWIMLLSGILGVLGGLIIVTGFPMSGLWVLGFVLGLDLIAHGVAWLVFGWMPAARGAQ